MKEGVGGGVVRIQSTVAELSRKMFSASNMMVAIDPAAGRYLTASAVYRGALSTQDVEDEMARSQVTLTLTLALALPYPDPNLSLSLNPNPNSTSNAGQALGAVLRLDPQLDQGVRVRRPAHAPQGACVSLSANCRNDATRLGSRERARVSRSRGCERAAESYRQERPVSCESVLRASLLLGVGAVRMRRDASPHGYPANGELLLIKTCDSEGVGRAAGSYQVAVAATFVGNHTAIQSVFQRIGTQFTSMFRRHAFVHTCEALPLPIPPLARWRAVAVT